MSTLYKGLGDVFGPKSTFSPVNNSTRNFERPRFGQVLDVVLDDTSEYYGTDLAIGAIRFRLMPEDSDKPEIYINNFALPLDRCNLQVPLPGEQVLIFPVIIGPNLYYVYSQVVQQGINPGYNAQPFIATNPEDINPNVLDLLVDANALSKRFEDKTQIPIEYYKQAQGYVRNLREGDFIIENRFGSCILFTSTMEKNIVQSLFKDLTIGNDQLNKSHTTEDGDPVIILQANKRASRVSNTELALTSPSINEDDSSVYLTTTQVIPLELASSTSMFSWNINITAKPGSTTFKPKVDTSTIALVESFPDRYDPNQRFTININGSLSFGGIGGGGGSGASLGLPESEALAYDLILSHEGTILEAMWDISNWRIGHGSSTFTLADGSIVKLPGDPTKWPTGFDPASKQLSFTDIGNEATTKGTFHKNGYMWKSKNSGRAAMNLITQIDADRDLARRVRDEFLPDTKKDVVSACKKAGLDGESIWTTLGKGAHAALCSIKYNYGNVTKNGAAAAAASSKGDKNVLANWIENQLEGGSKDRHRDEAFTCRTGQISG